MNYSREHYAKQREVSEVFNTVYNGKTNFMTPDVVQYYSKGNLYIELSTGSSFASTFPLYGVTVIEGREKMHDCSECFSGRNGYEEAMQYINELLGV